MKTAGLTSILASIGLLAATMSPTFAQNPGEVPPNPAGTFNFVIEIDGIDAGAFKSADGLNMEIEVIEYQDGNDLIVRKRPGRTKFGDITLKRGYLDSASLYSWFLEGIRNPLNLTRRTISIHLQDSITSEMVTSWNLIGCWPKQWKLNGFDGKGNDVITEEITFVVEEIRFGG